jgi:hypothetical protein
MSASVVSPELFDDEWFGQLHDREMLVWIGVFSRLRDDQGRFVENAALARARLFPYRDVPVVDVQRALDRFVQDGRLHRYQVDGQRLLQIITWWEHQKPQWATASKLPSPEGWTDRVRTRLRGEFYVVDWDSPGGFARDVRPNHSPETFGFAHDPEPEPEPKDQERCRKETTSDGAGEDFNDWWTAYGKIGSRADAERLYAFWRGKGAETSDLLTAAVTYRAHCERTDCKMQHARTFLAKPQKGARARWYEWAEGEDHGSMDVAGDDELASVLRAGALTYGSDNGGRSAVCESDQPTRLAGRRTHDRIGVSAQRLGQAN